MSGDLGGDLSDEDLGMDDEHEDTHSGSDIGDDLNQDELGGADLDMEEPAMADDMNDVMMDVSARNARRPRKENGVIRSLHQGWQNRLSRKACS